MINFVNSMLDSENQDELIHKISDTADLRLDGEFVMKNTGITSRVYNHYAKKGLVPNIPKVGEYKFKFRFIDIIWFNIVRELREFGFPLEKMKIIKDLLLEPILLNETLENIAYRNNQKKLMNQEDILGKEFQERITLYKELEKEMFGRKENPDGFRLDIHITPLQLIIGRFLFDRSDVRLLIDSKCQVFPLPTKSISHFPITDRMEEVGFDSESYISISILKFFKQFIRKKENQNFVLDNNFINEHELQILSLIREGKAKSLKITFEKEKPTYIEITEDKKVYAESRLSEVLLKNAYQNIEIKTQKGMIAYSTLTTNIKLK